MTNLEERLRSLRTTTVPPGPEPHVLQATADGRRRRRRLAAAGWVGAILIATVAILGSLDADDKVRVVGDQPPTSDEPSPGETPAVRTLGGLEGVTVEVDPTRDLLDGATLDIRMYGLDRLTDPTIVLCAGDVREDTVSDRCELRPLDRLSTSDSYVEVAARRTVEARRVIHLAEPFDCATEPAGCVLAVGNNDLPARAVLTPLTFRPVPMPEPVVWVEPDSGLHDLDPITVRATGLRAASSYSIQICTAGEDSVCDHVTDSARFDEQGNVETDTFVRAALYTEKGRIDCTARPCVVALREDFDRPAVATPITFAEDAVAPVPALELDPPGPYVDGQTITVRGSGFLPGFDLTAKIGQCPADKDTAVELRCEPILEKIIVDADGRFTTQHTLSETLMVTDSCTDEPGCVLGWVLHHGPIVAIAELTFED